MAGASTDFVTALVAIARGQGAAVLAGSARAPSLAMQALGREDELFDPVSHLQAYAGHTALHAAAFAYDVDTAFGTPGH